MPNTRQPTDTVDRAETEQPVNMLAIVVALTVLALLLTVIFWVVPALVGDSVINVTIRN